MINDSIWESKTHFIDSGAVDMILKGCPGWKLTQIYRNQPYEADYSIKLSIWDSKTTIEN
jgi:hypothetical protein